MEKINIVHGPDYLHLNFGITDERAEKLGKIVFDEIIAKAVERGIIATYKDENTGDEGLTVIGSKLAEALLNEVAQTTAEQIFLFVRFDDLLNNLGAKIMVMQQEADEQVE